MSSVPFPRTASSAADDDRSMFAAARDRQMSWMSTMRASAYEVGAAVLSCGVYEIVSFMCYLLGSRYSLWEPRRV